MWFWINFYCVFLILDTRSKLYRAEWIGRGRPADLEECFDYRDALPLAYNNGDGAGEIWESDSMDLSDDEEDECVCGDGDDDGAGGGADGDMGPSDHADFEYSTSVQ